jgi:hypothetical protein
LDKGIAHLAFSHDGKMLAATSMSDDHDIAIYNIEQLTSPKLLFKQKGVKDVVLAIKFSKTN